MTAFEKLTKISRAYLLKDLNTKLNKILNFFFILVFYLLKMLKLILINIYFNNKKHTHRITARNVKLITKMLHYKLLMRIWHKNITQTFTNQISLI